MVGFVPCVKNFLSKIVACINKFVQVKKLYHNARSNHKQRKSNLNHCMMFSVLLDQNGERDEEK